MKSLALIETAPTEFTHRILLESGRGLLDPQNETDALQIVALFSSSRNRAFFFGTKNVEKTFRLIRDLPANAQRRLLGNSAIIETIAKSGHERDLLKALKNAPDTIKATLVTDSHIAFCLKSKTAQKDLLAVIEKLPKQDCVDVLCAPYTVFALARTGHTPKLLDIIGALPPKQQKTVLLAGDNLFCLASHDTGNALLSLIAGHPPKNRMTLLASKNALCALANRDGWGLIEGLPNHKMKRKVLATEGAVFWLAENAKAPRIVATLELMAPEDQTAVLCVHNNALVLAIHEHAKPVAALIEKLDAQNQQKVLDSLTANMETTDHTRAEGLVALYRELSETLQKKTPFSGNDLWILEKFEQKDFADNIRKAQANRPQRNTPSTTQKTPSPPTP